MHLCNKIQGDTIYDHPSLKVARVCGRRPGSFRLIWIRKIHYCRLEKKQHNESLSTVFADIKCLFKMFTRYISILPDFTLARSLCLLKSRPID